MPSFELILIIGISAYVAFEFYVFSYFRSESFGKLKNNISRHVKSCNELNHHIEELKSAYVNIRSYDYGKGVLRDTSQYNFKRSQWTSFVRNSRVHNCSSTVLSNARNQPIKYLCKYFDIKVTKSFLSDIEEVLNSFAAAEQGKALLFRERNEIILSIKNQVPKLIFFAKKERLGRNLGLEVVDLSDLYFPVYTFQYISPGGNSSADLKIKLDVKNLESLARYMWGTLSYRNTVKGQRALMTARLREEVKKRDFHTCQMCGLSINHEPNLLLEIDHIIPVSKGGITCLENLQTLCWKCNRSKGAKYYS